MLLFALTAAVLAGLLLTCTASGKQLFPYKFDRSFDGSDSSAGPMSSKLTDLAINQSNGNVYVLDQHGTVGEVSQFDANGVAVPFSELPGVNTLSMGATILGGSTGSIEFDNTGYGGGLYTTEPFSNLRSFFPGGGLRWSHANCCNPSDIAVAPDGHLLEPYVNSTTQRDPTNGFAIGSNILYEQRTVKLEVDSDGFIYVTRNNDGPGIYKHSPDCELGGFGKCPIILRFSYVNTRNIALDAASNDLFAIEKGTEVTRYSDVGQPITTFGLPEGSYAGLTGASGIAVNKTTHDVYVTSKPGGVGQVDVFQRQSPITVPDATTVAAGHPNGTSGVLKGVINADEIATTECKFEWGTTSQYLNGAIPCDQGDVFTGSSDHDVSTEVKSLTLGATYHYRVAAKNANDQWSYGADRTFEASTPPTATALIVDRVNTDGARFTLTIDPRGGFTSYHFEVGSTDCTSNLCTHLPASDLELESNLNSQEVSETATGLTPNSGYYVRVVAESEAGEGTSSYFFHTYPSPPKSDPCGNAHVRQQTSAFLLPDCRAYELVSAANAGGYDVESELIPGQTPFDAYPDAKNRVLYGLHFGSVPGIAGSPTNYGLDPYVAERGQNGWTTKYVGLPADGMADEEPFGSPLLEADRSLDSFAFGGEGICFPCFEGLGSNLPLRLNGGVPIPGMAGEVDPGAAAPSGEVRNYLSADGEHLVFGSTKAYETAGVEGSLTLYERDLAAGTTQVVSTDDTGATLSGPGTAALDVSDDGSRVMIGKRESTDAAGNNHYHLYMHFSGSPQSADLTPGLGSSALYAGMTADGSRVFFTTNDKLLPVDDTDLSADVYEAEVSEGGDVTLKLVSVKSSTGEASNDDECSPPGSPTSWNAPSGDGKCNAVAVAGGGGVAADDGTFYFFSPEQLDGGGQDEDPGQPNLYVVKPGANPQFVETVDSSAGKPPPLPDYPVANANFTGGSLSGPEALAVDQSNSDVYVVETGAEKVARFKEDGTPHDFTEGTGAGTNRFSATLPSNSESQLAVDNSPSVFSGSVYVTNYPKISIYSQTGLELGSITGSGTSAGSFGFVCGVAIDQSNGAVYVGDYNGRIWRYLPTGSAPITDADYTVTGLATTGMSPCQVGADSAGHVYAAQWPNGPLKQFEAASFGAGPPPASSGTQLSGTAKGMYADPVSNELLVSEGNQIAVFKPNGEKANTFGSLSGSRGVAVNKTTHHVYASSGSGIVEFGYSVPPFVPIDNPAVVHAVKQAGAHSTADFQVTPDGRYAAFGSSQSLTGFANLGHAAIYRYDTQEDELECASCATTGAAAKADSFLSPHGLNISDDGRVFFTTQEGLVLTDTNEKRDAYEWSGGTNMDRISTGRSLDDSSLLSVSGDGRDVFFFTRDVLVPGDENGGAVKIYDAREGGGYLQTTNPLPCAASDECHGPGTQAPPPPAINSLSPSESTGGERPKRRRCRKRFVRRHGKCVKRRKHRKRGRHRTARRHNNHRTAGNG